MIPFFDNSNDNITVEEAKEAIISFEDPSDNLVVDSTIEEKHQFRDDSDSFSSHYDCITRNICNSILRLSTYQTLFTAVQNNNGSNESFESVFQSVSVPEAIFSSSATEMPITTSNRMDSILLMLYESGIDIAERSTIDTLVQLAEQSILNVGVYLSKTGVDYPLYNDYIISNYEFEKTVGLKTISELSSLKQKAKTEKRDYSSFVVEYGSVKQEKSITVPQSFISIMQFFIQKQVYPQLLLNFMHDRLDFYQKLLNIEMHITSLYPEIVNNPSAIASMSIEDLVHMNTIRGYLLSTMESSPNETPTNNSTLIDNLNEFFSSYHVLLIKQDNS